MTFILFYFFSRRKIGVKNNITLSFNARSVFYFIYQICNVQLPGVNVRPDAMLEIL